jgi:hypothetical protein
MKPHACVKFLNLKDFSMAAPEEERRQLCGGTGGEGEGVEEEEEEVGEKGEEDEEEAEEEEEEEVRGGCVRRKE